MGYDAGPSPSGITVSWHPRVSGRYEISITHAGQALPGSPWVAITSKPEAHAPECSVSGIGLLRAVARQEVRCEISNARDRASAWHTLSSRRSQAARSPMREIAPQRGTRSARGGLRQRDLQCARSRLTWHTLSSRRSQADPHVHACMRACVRAHTPSIRCCACACACVQVSFEISFRDSLGLLTSAVDLDVFVEQALTARAAASSLAGE